MRSTLMMHVDDNGGEQAERAQDHVEAADILVVVGGDPGQDRRGRSAVGGVGVPVVEACISGGHAASGLTW